MPWGMAAAAGISAVAGVGSSLLSSNAASSAADKANAAQRQALEQSRADLEPWRTTGGNANTTVTNLSGANGPDAATAAMADFRTSPGYAWQLDQGLRAVDAGAAAQGFGRSGAVLKAEQAFGSGLADQSFKDYYNRLFDLSKLGETAASGQSSASQNTGTGIAQTDLSEGSAQTSIYGNLGKGIGNTVDNYMNNRLYQERYGLGSGTSGPAYGNPGATAAGVPSTSSVYQPQVNMTLPANFGV
jgi:hypothetical protein